MSRPIVAGVLTAALLAALWAAPARGASAEECVREVPSFGICALDVAFDPQQQDLLLQAGSHPEALSVELAVNTELDLEGAEGPEIVATDELRDLRIFNPPGLVGNPDAAPRCSAAAFIVGGSVTNCPTASAVGTARIEFESAGHVAHHPVYNLAPAPGTAAKIGFVVANVAPVTVDLRLNPEPPHNVIAEVTNVTQVRYFFASTTTLWGVPADPSHDSERGRCLIKGGECAVSQSVPVAPFLTLPTRCDAPLETDAEARSWQDPGAWVKAPTALSHDDSGPRPPGGCDKLAFEPKISSRPTTDQAASPGPAVPDRRRRPRPGQPRRQSRLADQGDRREAAGGRHPQPLRRRRARGLRPRPVRGRGPRHRIRRGLPGGLEGGRGGSRKPAPGGEDLKGEVFVAEPYENPFGSLLAIYITVREPQRGVFTKLAGEISPDPETGQLTTTVEDIPQLPFSHFRFRFREGARSPLITPNACGTYTTEVELTPWANPSKPLTETDSFRIASGVGGGPCPSGSTPPFSPGFAAGTLDANAKSYSPFFARLTRRDGDQDMTKFSFKLPPGLVGKIAGVSRCPEAEIAAARAKSGTEELSSSSCPANSQIGAVLGGAGVGSQLTYVKGKLYLAGPVGAAPLSIVSIVPAVAGPFDVGNVVTRVALTLNPVTAQVEVDGANSEPLPHILAGIPLRVRDVRVLTDRPQFTLNPTDCSPEEIVGTLWGGGTDVFSALDDSPVSLTQPFGAVNCARLGFKPKLAIKLEGGTKRGAHPALKAVVTPRPDDANFQRAVVTLPRSAFLDQGHIRTICTRVQFAAAEGNGARCPAGAVYGKAKAWSPLLEEPLQGPVFLRSSDNNLPDLVIALHGLVDIELSSRIDSVKGGIRSTFESIPDAPVSRFVLEMQGGRKGLIVNSRNLCFKPNRNSARADLRGQNNRRRLVRPRILPLGCQQRRNR